MATTKSLFCTATLLLSVMALVNLQRAEAQCGGFRATCGDFDVSDEGIFTAQCNDRSGTATMSSIDLNNYISNINGAFFVPGADLSASCSGLAYSDGTGGTELYLVGGCAQDDGTTALAAYDLNSHISNDNGIISWHQC